MRRIFYSRHIRRRDSGGLGASHWTGGSAMLIAGQCTPHSLFVLDKKRTGCARSKRKNRFDALRCSGPPRDGGRRIGTSADLGWPSGTLDSSARSILPSRGGWCGGRRGGRRIASAPIFAAAGCSAREMVRRADVGIRPYKAECNPSLRRGRPACRPLRERQPQRRGRCPNRPESTSPHDRQGSAQQLRSRWRLCRLRLRRTPCG